MAMDQAAAAQQLARGCDRLGNIVTEFQASLHGQTDSIDRMFRTVQLLAMTVQNLNITVGDLIDALPVSARTHRLIPRVPQFDSAPQPAGQPGASADPSDEDLQAGQPAAPQPGAARTQRRLRPDAEASAAKRQRKD